MIEHNYPLPMFIFESHKTRGEVEAFLGGMADATGILRSHGITEGTAFCAETGRGMWEGQVNDAYIVQSDLSFAALVAVLYPLIEQEDAVLYVSTAHTKAGARNARLVYRNEDGAFIDATPCGNWRRLNEVEDARGWTMFADGSVWVCDAGEAPAVAEPMRQAA